MVNNRHFVGKPVMVSLNGRLFNISGYNFYREITPEHPRQFHMEVALGDRPQVWKEILILLEKVHMSDVVTKDWQTSTTKRRRKINENPTTTLLPYLGTAQ